MEYFVAILEDDSRRITEMRACLREVLPGIEGRFFENAKEMIGWFARLRS